MEYQFSTEAGKLPCLVTLTQHTLTIKQDGNKLELPLQDVRSVSIEKSGKTCKTHIETARAFSIVITNYLIKEDGIREDKSNAYTLMIRLLHQYLDSNPKAEFFRQNNHLKTWLQASMILLLALLSLLILHYLGWTLDSFTVGLVGVGAFVPTLVVIWLNRFPKTYKPAEIPLELLP